MTFQDVVRELVVGFVVVGVTLLLSVVIVNVLFRVDAVRQIAVGRVRCALGRHGWITVTFTDFSAGWEPRSKYRVCATCRRREDLIPEGN